MGNALALEQLSHWCSNLYPVKFARATGRVAGQRMKGNASFGLSGLVEATLTLEISVLFEISVFQQKGVTLRLRTLAGKLLIVRDALARAG
jgi:hypothetical protein